LPRSRAKHPGVGGDKHRRLEEPLGRRGILGDALRSRPAAQAPLDVSNVAVSDGERLVD
jgi:hypothetical protein